MRRGLIVAAGLALIFAWLAATYSDSGTVAESAQVKAAVHHRVVCIRIKRLRWCFRKVGDRRAELVRVVASRSGRQALKRSLTGTDTTEVIQQSTPLDSLTLDLRALPGPSGILTLDCNENPTDPSCVP